MSERSIKVVANVAELAREAAQRVQRIALSAVHDRGAFSIALSGGSTPKVLYNLLTAEPYHSAIPWGKVAVYFGDERCVRPDHPDSNYHMADRAMLSVLPFSPQSVHRMEGEREPPAAAADYDALLHDRFPVPAPGMDLVLLGMGDDGHTASLFPYSPALVESRRWCVAAHVERLKAWRITMTAPFINRAAHVLVLVSGSSKARRLHEVIAGPHDPMRLPIQLIDPAQGALTWLLDEQAAGLL